MMYVLGVDLGTTYTAAAVWRNGHAEIASLGSRAAVIPSVVLLRKDETMLTGEPAHRRGITEPQRVSREFKRRLGDPTPILLGGAPYSAEALMGRLLRAVVAEVEQREGGRPARLCVSHPANWGPYKRDLLSQAVRLADLEVPATFVTEPAAAAIFYAQQQRVEPGALVAVYDLGGGTFDASVLRKEAHGFSLLGTPEGIDQLGGIDFDAAVFAHVRTVVGAPLSDLDDEDPAVLAAVVRLREECVQAKETLSSDTDVSIPVLLPNVSTEVRLTRSELEAMVRPTLQSTIEALRRALRSADVTPEQLDSVLLVGGSSRMPLVAQLVGAELGRPVAVDAHPKHAVALGAAWLASGAEPAPPPPAPAPAAPLPTTPVAAPSPALASAALPPPSALPTQPASPSSGPAEPAPVASAAPAAPGRVMATASVPVGTGHTARLGPPAYTSGQSGLPAGPPPPPPSPPGGTEPGPSGRRPWALPALAGVLVVAIAIVLGWWYLNRPGNDDQARNGGTPSAPASGSASPGSPSPDPLPEDEQCTEEIRSNERWVCLTSATLAGQVLTIAYEADWAGSTPNRSGGFHLHLYGGDGTEPADEIMGTHWPAGQRGDWIIEDRPPPLSYPVDDARDNLLGYIDGQDKVCARIADGNHQLVADASGGYRTGNCVPITG